MRFAELVRRVSAMGLLMGLAASSPAGATEWLSPTPTGFSIRGMAVVDDVLFCSTGKWQLFSYSSGVWSERLLPSGVTLVPEAMTPFQHSLAVLGQSSAGPVLLVLGAGSNWAVYPVPTEKGIDTARLKALPDGLAILTDDGRIIRSADLVKWETYLVEEGTALSALEFFTGRWLAVARKDALFVSSDLKNWEKQELGGPWRGGDAPEPIRFTGAVIAAGKAVVSADTAYDSVPSVWISEDLESWHPLDVGSISSEGMPLGWYPPLSAMAAHGDEVWAVGPDLLMRIDAKSLAGEMFLVPSNTPMLSPAPYGNYRRAPSTPMLTVFVNGPGDVYFGGLDGEVWRFSAAGGEPFSALSTGRRDHLHSIAKGGDRMVIVGSDQHFPGYESRIWWSDNGGNFQLADDVHPYPLYDVAYGAEKWVAVGGIPFLGHDWGRPAHILVSEDGNKWEPISYPPANPPMHPPRLFNVTFSKGQFFAAGDGGYMLRSEDGLGWTRVDMGTTATLLDMEPDSDGGVVVVGFGGFIAKVGTDGTVQRLSADLPPGGSWKAIARGNGLWMLAGSSSEIRTSLDLKNWTSRSKVPVDPNSLRFVQGRFYAIGGFPSGAVYESTHGSHWRLHGGLSESPMRDLEPVDGSLIVVGDNGAVVRVQAQPYLFHDTYAYPRTGWKYSYWFGNLYDLEYPWIYHLPLGWLYSYGGNLNDAWFYSPTRGYLWSSQVFFPWVYYPNNDNWERVE